MNEKIKVVAVFILKNIGMLFILSVAIFQGVKLIEVPTRDNPQLIEKIAMDVAVEFLENKDFFSAYEQCASLSADDALFKENSKLQIESELVDVILYSPTYSVTAISKSSIFSKKEYVTCKARVFSKVQIRQGMIEKLLSTGLVLSEEITVKGVKGVIFEKNYLKDTGNLILLLLLGSAFLIFWLGIYMRMFFNFKRELHYL